MIIEGSGQASAVKVLCVMFRSRGDGLNPIIVYQYPPARNGDAAAKFIQESLPGTYINVDGYADYNKLKDFKRCCCYAHYPRSIVIPEEMQISA